MNTLQKSKIFVSNERFVARNKSCPIMCVLLKNLIHRLALILTINVPVVYMGRYKVVLRGDYP